MKQIIYSLIALTALIASGCRNTPGGQNAESSEENAITKVQPNMIDESIPLGNIEEVRQFLQDAGYYFLATVDDTDPFGAEYAIPQARVRPFGTAEIFEGKLYIQTGKVKDVYKQIVANPNVEICAVGKDGTTWLRIAGQLVPDERVEAKQYMLDQNPGLKQMYSATDDNTIVLYFQNAVATFSSFTAEPRTVRF